VTLERSVIVANQYSINKKKKIEVLDLYFFCRWTMKSIAKKLRLSKRTVKRIIKDSLKGE
jgi:DNA-directed RNA polymerase specialized sigma subunit